MSHRHEKLLNQMRRHSQGWRIEQLETLAKMFGVQIRKTGGSHVVFTHGQWGTLLCVPARRPLKGIYVKRFVALIDELEEVSNGAA